MERQAFIKINDRDVNYITTYIDIYIFNNKKNNTIIVCLSLET